MFTFLTCIIKEGIVPQRRSSNRKKENKLLGASFYSVFKIDHHISFHLFLLSDQEKHSEVSQ